MTMSTPHVELSVPRPDQGAELWVLARDSGKLDLNSSYAYLMWCRDFADTSVVATVDGRAVGFITGYRRPSDSSVLFVWQVAVSESARGMGVAGRMLDHLVDRVVPRGVRWMETTVTPDNEPSQRMFRGLARRRGAEVDTSVLFTADHFPDPPHEAEELYRIGPFAPVA